MVTNNAYYEKIILDAIDTDGYDTTANTPKEKLQFLRNRFKSEYGFSISRMGETRALSEWLSGLSINLPFYNYDILELARKGGSLAQNATEKQEEKILENYWVFMANQIMKMWRKYKIN
jgi:hypothetical protein